MTTSETPPAPISWRHRLANHLLGGELLELRSREAHAQHLVEQLRAANEEERSRRRQATGRMLQAMALDVTLERQMRAVVLLGALLHRFRRDPDRGVLVAEASQVQLDHWCSLHEDLSRARDSLDVADREPEQPAHVHASSVPDTDPGGSP